MAAPIEVQRNCFYKKHNITTEGAVKLLPTLPDAALTGTRMINLEGGTKANIYLLSGAIPDRSVGMGSSNLVGGDLIMYCSGVNLSSVAALPDITVYNAVSGATFSEGAMELSHGWELITGSGSNSAGGTTITGTGTSFKEVFDVDDEIKIGTQAATIAEIASDTSMTTTEITSASTELALYKPRFYGDELAVYTAHADLEVYTYNENFDGDKSLGKLNIPGYTVSGPYINFASEDGSAVANKLYAGGNYSLTYGTYQAIVGDEGAKATGSNFFTQYFGTNREEERGETSYSGSVVTTEVWDFSTQDYTEVTYNNITVTEPPRHCVFIKPVDADKPDDLWIPKYDFRADMEQIMVFTPYWRWKDIKKYVEYKDTEKTDPEYAEDVTPNNTIFDAGMIFATPNLNTYYGGGDAAGLPVNKSIVQISSEAYDDGGQSLNMYHLWSYSAMMGDIDSQYGITGAANPQYGCVGLANIPYPQCIDHAWSATNSYAPDTDLTHTNVTLPEINIKFNIKEMDSALYLASSKGSGPKDIQGVFTDYMYGKAGDAGDNYDEAIYISGTTSGSFDETFRTLGRNFTILFSNYPPNEGESLDSFIHRGMKDYYNGAAAGNLYVGGMTVFRDEPKNGVYDTASSTTTAFSKGMGGVATAMPLQTGRSSYALSMANTISPNDALDIDNVRDRLLKFNNASGNTAQSADLMCFAGVPSRDGNPENGNGAAGGVYEHGVPLQMDQFVNAKFVFNPLGVSVGATGAATNNNFYDMCRVYFTEGIANGEVTDIATTGGAAIQTSSYDEELMSFPIYWPTYLGAATARKAFSWAEFPNLWPRYMTLWTTNYRNANNTTVSTDELTGETQPWTGYSSNYANFGLDADYPLLTGSDKQVNVFVDNIRMSGFTNQVTNASTKAVGNSQNIVIKQHPVQTSVAPPIDTGATGQVPVYQNSSLLTNTLNSAYMPTYVLLGYDNGPMDFYDFPNTGAATGTTQWYQWHGFATSAYESLQIQGNEASQSFYSNTKVGAGYQNAVYGNWLYGYKTINNAYNQWGQNALSEGGWATSWVNGIDYAKLVYGTRTAVGELPDDSDEGGFGLISGSNTHLFTDGLTQKGFMNFAQTGTYFDDWKKSEHPFVSAKITKIPLEVDDEPNDGSAIIVDNAAIFDMPLSEEYIIYMVPGTSTGSTAHYGTDSWDYAVVDTSATFSGTLSSTETQLHCTSADFGSEIRVPGVNDFWSKQSIANSGYLKTGAYLAVVKDSDSSVQEVLKINNYQISGSGAYDVIGVSRAMMGTSAGSYAGTSHSLFAVTTVKAAKGLKQTKPREGNMIFLDTPSIDAIVNDSNLPYIYISPYKYWHWFQMWPGANLDETGTLSTSYIADVGCSGSAKSYASLSMMKAASAATGSTGTTYSEKEYFFNAAGTGTKGLMSPYFNLWNLEPASTGSTLNTQVDYGSGVWTEETREGGQVTNRQTFNNIPVAFNLDGMVRNNQYSSGDAVLNKIQLTQPLLSSSAVFFGNDFTTVTGSQGVLSGTVLVQEDVKPYYLWRYRDDMPIVHNFNVTPAFNVLDRETNLYELTNEDLSAVKFSWEESADDVWYRMLFVDRKSIHDKYHGFQSDGQEPLFYAPLNDTPTSMLAAPTLTFTESTTDSRGTSFNPTVAANGRLTPDGIQGYGYDCGVSGTAGIIVPSGNCKFHLGAAKYTLIMHIVPAAYAGTAVQTLFNKGTSNGLTITIDSNGHIDVEMAGGATLTSQTITPRDGTTPMMIAVTFNTGSKQPCKLYIDGQLEDYSLTGTTIFTQTGVNGYIADNSAASLPYFGKIEEIILYGTEMTFPSEAGHFTLGGEYLSEYDGNTVHAKVFICDYHNIRGKGDDEICSTSTLGWRTTNA